MPDEFQKLGKLKLIPDAVKRIGRKSMMSNLNKSKGFFSIALKAIAVRKYVLFFKLFC
jgi:hypothetical protein